MHEDLKLPYPNVYRKKVYNGYLFDAPKECLECKNRECLRGSFGSFKSKEIGLCSYGFNYIKLNNDVSLIGFVLNKMEYTTNARRKKVKKYKSNIVSLEHLERYLQHSEVEYNKLKQAFEQELQIFKNMQINKYINSKEYKKDTNINLRYSMSFIHDYRQINTHLIQNINIILCSKYNDSNIENFIDSAEENEKALYYSAKLLDSKLDAAAFLLNTDLLSSEEERVSFKFHGLVHKLCRIYENSLNQKFKFSGHSEKNIVAIPDAAAIIPQTLIDNAQKYSPKDSQVEIYVNDELDHIDFRITSYGPKIEDKSKIFQLGYRCESAKLIGPGTGIGLYLAQLIATEHMRTIIDVSQDTSKINDGLYLTQFSIQIPFEV